MVHLVPQPLVTPLNGKFGTPNPTPQTLDTPLKWYILEEQVLVVGSGIAGLVAAKSLQTFGALDAFQGLGCMGLGLMDLGFRDLGIWNLGYKV